MRFAKKSGNGLACDLRGIPSVLAATPLGTRFFRSLPTVLWIALCMTEFRMRDPHD